MASSVVLEKVVYQRDQARDERDRCLALIRKLVELDGAPRSVHFGRAWQNALEDARDVLTDAFAHRPSAEHPAPDVRNGSRGRF